MNFHCYLYNEAWFCYCYLLFCLFFFPEIYNFEDLPHHAILQSTPNALRGMPSSLWAFDAYSYCAYRVTLPQLHLTTTAWSDSALLSPGWTCPGLQWRVQDRDALHLRHPSLLSHDCIPPSCFHSTQVQIYF